jgi:lipopolysaccharide/colanic/teichoic acid biosynthesis glycosyltransferase
VYPAAKRLFDIVFALLGLVLTLPLFAVIALLIKRDSEGPVFYRAPRVGKDGKPFKMLKFRTMVANADKIGGPSTANDDPRITRVGRFLRRYKLDELPQLINVLKGEMSFVGPRPEVQQYVDMYTEEEKAILTVKPGITDWASLWNSDEGAVLAGSPDPEKAYLELIRPTKIKLQLEYVRKRSFLTDLGILLRTVMAVVCRSTSPAVSELGGCDGSTRDSGRGRDR